MPDSQAGKKLKRPLHGHSSPDGPEHNSDGAVAASSILSAPSYPSRKPKISILQYQPQSSGKVAIPRLHRASDDREAQLDKGRVNRACEACRNRKTKCSGDRPTCKHCEESGLECIYGEGKRDRDRRRLEILAERAEGYESLLKELGTDADRPTQERIAQALDKDIPLEVDATPPSGAPKSVRQELVDGENHFTASAGSTEDLGRVNEDLNHDAVTRATGYHGKNSVLTWMQRLRQSIDTSGEGEADSVFPATDTANVGHSQNISRSSGLSPINLLNYHCDDPLNILTDGHVDPFWRPPRQIADVLFKRYLDLVHPAFPIVAERLFKRQYRAFWNQQAGPNNKWLAILNCIFAIGARYAELTSSDWPGESREHRLYFTRAVHLSFDLDSFFEHADLQQVQLHGLMAFYLMSCNQINRSWTLSGLAIRHASALGLNLRNDSFDVQAVSREIRYRVWWALCTLEHQVALMTGRPASFPQQHCSVPLPLPVDEEDIVKESPSPRSKSQISHHHHASATSSPFTVHSGIASNLLEDLSLPVTVQKRPSQMPAERPNLGLFFKLQVELSLITEETMSRLYRAECGNRTWAQTQATMIELDDRLKRWRQDLPFVLDSGVKQDDERWTRRIINLGFLYHSTRLIVNRPCLRRVDERIINESDRARDTDQAIAANCVQAAQDMLGLLPNDPDIRFAFDQSPWWHIVRFLVEAAAVCMLELSFRCEHMPKQVERVFSGAIKAFNWLERLCSRDIAARKATSLCGEMLWRVAPRVGKTVDDLPPALQMMGPFDTSQQSSYHESSFQFATDSDELSAAFQPSDLASYDDWFQA